jgi:cyclophilin family peptidyl-prolyl cis-trans isomerase
MLRPTFALSSLASLLACLGCGSPPQTCLLCGNSGTEADSDSETDTGATETDSGATETDETETGETEAGETEAPDPCMSDTPIVVLETNLGTMVAQLDRVRAPISVDNFIHYVGTGFYDGTIFHRVIDGFVVQGGGFEPGLVVKEMLAPPIPLEIHPELLHVDGAIAMARNNAPDTAQAQFYITDGAQPGLDNDYAVFGVLIDGLPVRDAISQVPVQTVPWMGFDLMDVPVTDVVLEAAYCVETWP